MFEDCQRGSAGVAVVDDSADDTAGDGAVAAVDNDDNDDPVVAATDDDDVLASEHPVLVGLLRTSLPYMVYLLAYRVHSQASEVLGLTPNLRDFALGAGKVI